jgi:hypothetical protein
MKNKQQTQFSEKETTQLADKTYKRYDSQELPISNTQPFISKDQALEYLATILVQAYIKKKIS